MHTHEPVPDRVVAEHMPLVRILASQAKRRLPPQTAVDDLVSAGYVGLVKAARAFDATKGARFSTYAAIRINGEIQDYIRSESGCRLRHRIVFEQLNAEVHERPYLPNIQQTLEVRRAVAKSLTSRERRVLAGLFVGGHSAEALSRVMRLGATTIRAARRSALGKLRTAMT